MRRLICVAVLLLSVSAWAQVSLGDFARQQRASKPAASAHVITNDDLSGASRENSPASSTTAAASASAAGVEANSKSKPSASAALQPSPVEVFKEKERAFRALYAEQKSTVERLTRQLRVAEHEYDDQTTAYWADAGTQLRQGTAWVDKRTRLENEISQTRSQLNSAQQKLDAIREDAHRAGLSDAIFETPSAGPVVGLIP